VSDLPSSSGSDVERLRAELARVQEALGREREITARLREVIESAAAVHEGSAGRRTGVNAVAQTGQVAPGVWMSLRMSLRGGGHGWGVPCRPRRVLWARRARG
jgi:hypothetical protein